MRRIVLNGTNKKMKHDKNQDINGLTCNFFHSPGITTVHLYHEQNPSNYMFIDMYLKKW